MTYLPMIAKTMVSGKQIKGTKKYVNMSLGGRESLVAVDVLSYIFSLGSISPA